ncbi:hypothetical protein GW915_07815 [bacterium]|nr:hypothetical protein [bacterium]
MFSRKSKSAPARRSSEKGPSQQELEKLQKIDDSYFLSKEHYQTALASKDFNKAKVSLVKKNKERYEGAYLNFEHGVESKLGFLPRRSADSLVESYTSGLLKEYYGLKSRRKASIVDGFSLFAKLLIGSGDVNLNRGEVAIVDGIVKREDYQDNFNYMMDAISAAYPDREQAQRQLTSVIPSRKRGLLPDFVSIPEFWLMLDQTSDLAFRNLATDLVMAKIEQLKNQSPEFANIKVSKEQLSAFLLQLAGYEKGAQPAAAFPFFRNSARPQASIPVGTYQECLGRSLGATAKAECLNSFVEASTYPAFKFFAESLAKQGFQPSFASEGFADDLKHAIDSNLKNYQDFASQKKAIADMASEMTGKIVQNSFRKAADKITLENGLPDSLRVSRHDSIMELADSLQSSFSEMSEQLLEHSRGRDLNDFILKDVISSEGKGRVAPSDKIVLKAFNDQIAAPAGIKKLKKAFASMFLSEKKLEEYNQYLASPKGELKDPILLRFESHVESLIKNGELSARGGQERVVDYVERLLTSKPDRPSLLNRSIARLAPVLQQSLSDRFAQIEAADEEGEKLRFDQEFSPELESVLDLFQKAHSVPDFRKGTQTLSCRSTTKSIVSLLDKKLLDNGGKSFSVSQTEFLVQFIDESARSYTPSLLDCIVLGFAKTGTTLLSGKTFNDLIESMGSSSFSGETVPFLRGLQKTVEPAHMHDYLNSPNSSAHTIKEDFREELVKILRDPSGPLGPSVHNLSLKYVPKLVSDAATSSVAADEILLGMFSSMKSLESRTEFSGVAENASKPLLANATEEDFRNFLREIPACAELVTKYHWGVLVPSIDHFTKIVLNKLNEEKRRRIKAGENPGQAVEWSADEFFEESTEASRIQLMDDFSKVAKGFYAQLPLSDLQLKKLEDQSLNLTALLTELGYYISAHPEKFQEGAGWSVLEVMGVGSDFNMKDHYFKFNDQTVRAWLPALDKNNQLYKQWQAREVERRAALKRLEEESAQRAPSGIEGEKLRREIDLLSKPEPFPEQVVPASTHSKGSILFSSLIGNILAPAHKLGSWASFLKTIEEDKGSNPFKAYLNESCRKGEGFVLDTSLGIEAIYETWRRGFEEEPNSSVPGHN